MKVLIYLITACLAFGLAGTVSAQKNEKQPAKDWYLQEASKDVNGISLDQAYEFLTGKTPEPIIVCVMDGGTDIKHEDLVNVLWKNEDEIPGNGIDDDKNGYVDDIYGWNFIGGADGKMVGSDNLEKTRLLRKLSKEFKGNLKAEDINDPARSAKYAYYQSLKMMVNQELAQFEPLYERYSDLMTKLNLAKELTGSDNPDAELLKSKTKGSDAEKLGEMLAGNMKRDPMATFKVTYDGVKGAHDYYEKQVKYYLNVDFDSRDIVGDDYANSSEMYYGNNDVAGPDAAHGTHVAGIIAADRTNTLGINGVSNATKIMVVRVVPDGDERDKDVANGIRYAVDNGAKIINMSFGKSFSWDKKIVNEAVKYAESKGVLLVHAAGNDNKNNDLRPNYPNDSIEGGFASNWLEIGASRPACKELPASFSNYGRNQVDIFAPGYQIYSSTPDNNYEFFNGTSMAAPVAAGLAALVWSYYPKLTASQVKEILLESGIKHRKRVPVPSDGEKGKKARFTKLSVTGKVINAYNAVKLADKMSK